MKFSKTFRLVLVLFLVLPIIPLNAKADTGTDNASSIAGNNEMKAVVEAMDGEKTVNLYEDATVDSTILATIPSSSEVTVVKPETEFTYVKYQPQDSEDTWFGYVKTELLLLSKTTEENPKIQESAADEGKNSDRSQETKVEEQNVDGSPKDQSKKLKNYSVETAEEELKDSSKPVVKVNSVKEEKNDANVSKVSLLKANISTQKFTGIALENPTHVYSSTSVNSQVLKSYPEGSILIYRSYNTDWYICTVIINGKAKTGYIHKNDVENSVTDPESFTGIGLKDPTKVYSEASRSFKVLKDYDKDRY